MKRSPLKRKTPLRAKSPMNRGSRVKKQSAMPISKLQRLLWAECKRIVRARYKRRCYTCDSVVRKKRDCQTGHVPWPKAVLGAYLKYDLRCLRIQCFSCNIHRGGMGAEAYKRMLAEIGHEAMEKLEQDRRVTVKASDHYARLLAEYRALDR